MQPPAFVAIVPSVTTAETGHALAQSAQRIERKGLLRGHRRAVRVGCANDGVACFASFRVIGRFAESLFNGLALERIAFKRKGPITI
jgi:hypothetical protein